MGFENSRKCVVVSLFCFFPDDSNDFQIAECVVLLTASGRKFVKEC